MGGEETLIFHPSWGGGSVDGGTIRDGGAIGFEGRACDVRPVGVRRSTGKGRDIPPELGGDVGELKIFVIQGGAKNVVEVGLRFRAIGDSVVRGGGSETGRDRERFRRLGHWGVDKFRGNVSEIWTNNWRWGSGFCGDLGWGVGWFREWGDGTGVIVIMGDGVIRRVEKVFWVIGVGTDSRAGVFKINDALEF